MIELIFLFFVLPKKMTKLARERNRSALKWSLAAIGAWIGAEIVVIVLTVILLFVTSAIWGVPADPESVSGFAYLPALVAAFVGAEIIIRKLRRMPKAGEEEYLKGPPMPWEQEVE